MQVPSTFRRCGAEALGTFVIVFFGCGAVHAAVFAEAFQGLFQVAAVWGLAVGLAIACTGHVSGAHLNPAVTVALACRRGFAPKMVVPYVTAQFLGAILAAVALHLLYSPLISAVEERGIRRGEPESVAHASAYGEFYPAPGVDRAFRAAHPQQKPLVVPLEVAFFAEFLGTALLGLVIAAVTDPGNGPTIRQGAPLWIGTSITVLICVLAPLTQACFNPARDLGPRLVAAAAGWGTVAFGPDLFGTLLVYALAPCLGACAGFLLHDGLLRLPPAAEETP